MVFLCFRATFSVGHLEVCGGLFFMQACQDIEVNGGCFLCFRERA